MTVGPMIDLLPLMLVFGLLFAGMFLWLTGMRFVNYEDPEESMPEFRFHVFSYPSNCRCPRNVADCRHRIVSVSAPNIYKARWEIVQNHLSRGRAIKMIEPEWANDELPH